MKRIYLIRRSMSIVMLLALLAACQPRQIRWCAERRSAAAYQHLAATHRHPAAANADPIGLFYNQQGCQQSLFRAGATPWLN